MRSWSVAARIGRMAAWGMAAGLLFTAQGARGQEDAQKRDTEWVSKHLDLDLLPVAFVVPRGRLTIGGPMNLTPAGFPADTYALYPNLLYGITARTEVGVGVTGAERLGPGGEAIFYMLGVQHALSLGSRKF